MLKPLGYRIWKNEWGGEWSSEGELICPNCNSNEIRAYVKHDIAIVEPYLYTHDKTLGFLLGNVDPYITSWFCNDCGYESDNLELEGQ